MAQQEKKISFGFSKIIKKPELNIKSEKDNEKKVDYIKYVDEKSIKIIGEDDTKKTDELVIPMLGSRSWHNVIVDKINANNDRDIQNGKEEKVSEKDSEVIKRHSSNFAEERTNPQESKKHLTLDEQAAQEIVNDLRKKPIQGKTENLVINQASNVSSNIQEPTAENYEEIPIEKFGVAMLRGMGWNPDEGIGKNAQVVKTVQPTLRPKGIGLGADKAFQHNLDKSKTNDVKLKLEKGGYVKIIAGNLQGNYGIIESFDDNSGRIIVKLASTNKIVSLTEVIVQPITKTVYEKNSRVINSSTYEKYKDEISSTIEKDKKHSSHKSEQDREKHIKNNTILTTRTNRDLSSSSSYDSDNEKNHTEKSSDKHRSKRKKKSNHKRHYDSSEFSSERKEKKRHKKEKKRHKDEKYHSHKHKRSRS